MIRSPTDEEVTRRLAEAAELTSLCLSLPRSTTAAEDAALVAVDAWLKGDGDRPSIATIRRALAVLWARKEHALIVRVGDRLTPPELAADDHVDTYVFHAREWLARHPPPPDGMR